MQTPEKLTLSQTTQFHSHGFYQSQSILSSGGQGLLVVLMTFMLLLAFQTSAIAGLSTLEQLRVGDQPNKTRVVFDLTEIPDYTIQTLSSPNRLIIDFEKTQNGLSFSKKFLKDPRLFSINVKNTARQTRIILALHKSLDYNQFVLGKNKRGHKRLVVDLRELKPVKKTVKTPLAIAQNKSSKQPLVAKNTAKIAEKATKPIKTVKVAKHSKPVTVAKTAQGSKQTSVLKSVKQTVMPKSESIKVTDLIKQTIPSEHKIVVAIDAGHGGKDPGAIGRNGLYEKTVTLQVAKRLQKLIEKTPNMRAVMIRDRDVFVPLKDRIKIAKQHKADIFLSIHADAFRDSRVKGGSVYVLSQNGASSTMAQLMAQRENQSLQAIDLSGFENDVAYALSDMSREANIRVSRKLAKNVVRSMNRSVEMHKETVQSANFAVLKTIDMPAMLIETAFLSNPDEERKLKNPRFQQKVAKAIVGGLNEFVVAYSDQPRWGEKLYVRYKVKSGDTLSEIAEEHGVSVAELKKINRIRNANQLYKGKVMKIPVSDRYLAKL